jgi:capsular polysaccharide export protein
MRSFTETIKMFRPWAGPLAGAIGPRRGLRGEPAGDRAMAALFPELASDRRQPGAAAIAAWVGSRGAARMRARASEAGLPFALLAEGLLRAPLRGRSPPPCLSALAQESSGPGSPSDVATPGRILAERAWENPALLARAAAARRALATARVGGAWWHGGAIGELPAGEGYAVVLLAEPSVADSEPAPGDGVLRAMLDTALAENPADRVVILAPGLAPGAIGRRLQAALAAAAARGAAVIFRALDPWLLLDRATRVYSAGGETGFLALVAGVPVAAFGSAFYTGWGATEDAPALPVRPFRRTIDEIFAGSCLVATRYLDPFRNTLTAFEEVLAILADWRRTDEANRRIAVCVGMSFWKRRRIAEFLRSSAGVPVFRRTAAGALAAARRESEAPPRAIAGWASRLPEGLAEAAARQGVPLIRVEDGFIRSVGLGSDFLPPASLVLDSRGMYFDPRVRSDLNVLLCESEFAPALVARATRLAAQLVARGITKYNLAGRGPGIKAGTEAGIEVPAGMRRILVPGQVEDDLSIRHGAGRVRTNLGLLAEVRSANPDAFILYKPHPDVAAGHRIGAVPEAEARRFADAVVRAQSTAALLARVDELHTMTSLAGFEALLRGRRVVVYGRPFYAGWGLTIDLPPQDRGRRLTLAELVAGVLILYPRYLDPLTGLPCGPEVVIDRLDHPELWRPGPLVLARRLQGAAARRLGDLRAMLPVPGPAAARGLKVRLRD